MTTDRKRRPGFGFLAHHRVTIAVAVAVSIVSSGTVAAVSYVVLGASNTAATTTTLKSAVNGAVLQVTNTNTAGGTSAKGIGITVPAGRAPISVNSTAGKATNLDADKLDGLDSTKFARGRRTTLLANRIVVPPVQDEQTLVLGLPGLGEVWGACPEGPSTSAGINFTNTGTETVTAFRDSGGGAFTAHTLPPNEGLILSQYMTDTASGSSLDTDITAGTPPKSLTASIHTRAYRAASGADCEFAATVILWSEL